MRRKLVAGNWKMHGSLTENEALLGAVRSGMASDFAAECAVCVPFPYLAQTSALLGGSVVAWGAQDVSEHTKGAYTGEVSAPMLREFGCRFVIVGHSERRALHAEDSKLVARKLHAAQAAGLTPIVCVGETLAQREAGVTEAIVAEQLDAVTSEVGAQAWDQAVIAYEPVWAIGTGQNATPQQAQEAHAHIRGELRRLFASHAAEIRILYGGSVKADNAEAIMAQPDVDGALVGGASLKADSFLGILRGALAVRR